MIGALTLVAVLTQGASPQASGPARHAQVYTVKPGDSLWDICADATGHGEWWPGLYAANRAVIGDNPDRIFPYERFKLKCRAGRVPAGTAVTPVRPMPGTDEGDRDDTDGRPSLTVPSVSSPLHGTLSCAGLETLWAAAGGPRWAAFTAAEIAMAESSGEQYATGPAGERGYWQINPDHGALSTYDPLGNARAAVIISAGGTDWSPWTTYVTGAYLGRC